MQDKKRKNIVDLTGHERNYNYLFDEIQRNVDTFDRNKISNGKYTFHDFIDYLKEKELYNEFEIFVKHKESLESILEENNSNIEEDFLPFTNQK